MPTGEQIPFLKRRSAKLAKSNPVLPDAALDNHRADQRNLQDQQLNAQLLGEADHPRLPSQRRAGRLRIGTPRTQTESTQTPRTLILQ